MKGEKGDPGICPKCDDDLAALEREALRSELDRVKKWLTFALGRKVGRKLYLTNGRRMTFDRVKALCAHFQASMAVPINAEENKAIQYVSKGEEAFLGITDKKMEGQFVDLSERPVTYQNWNAKEPNNANSEEHCVVIQSEGTWNDIICSSSHLAVCEFPV